VTLQDEDEPHGPDGTKGEVETNGEEVAHGGAPADVGGGENVSRVSVTIDQEHLDALPRVVEALRERGMQVDAVLEGLGMVTGRASDAAVLRQVEGVSAVDAELEHQLPPPEDDIQ
jgi:hypothetical protein